LFFKKPFKIINRVRFTSIYVTGVCLFRLYSHVTRLHVTEYQIRLADCSF